MLGSIVILGRQASVMQDIASINSHVSMQSDTHRVHALLTIRLLLLTINLFRVSDVKDLSNFVLTPVLSLLIVGLLF